MKTFQHMHALFEHPPAPPFTRPRAKFTPKSHKARAAGLEFVSGISVVKVEKKREKKEEKRKKGKKKGRRRTF